jgi:hypothetical protein
VLDTKFRVLQVEMKIFLKFFDWIMALLTFLYVFCFPHDMVAHRPEIPAHEKAWYCLCLLAEVI